MNICYQTAICVCEFSPIDQVELNGFSRSDLVSCCLTHSLVHSVLTLRVSSKSDSTTQSYVKGMGNGVVGLEFHELFSAKNLNPTEPIKVAISALQRGDKIREKSGIRFRHKSAIRDDTIVNLVIKLSFLQNFFTYLVLPSIWEVW